MAFLVMLKCLSHPTYQANVVNMFRSSQEWKVQDERDPSLAEISGWKVYQGSLDLKRAQHIERERPRENQSLLK